jgi:c-di-GMP phosphodiesterase
MSENLTQTYSAGYCIALQPICDAQLRHVADELLYRASVQARGAIIEDPIRATARVCNAAFYEAGVEALCGQRKLFFNAPRDWLLQPDLLPPDPQQVVIEVLETVEGDGEVIQALEEVKARGYTLALDDFVLTAKTRPLLELADIIKLDMLEAPPQLGDLDLYRGQGLTLLAEKVEDFATYQHCVEQGFELFQGYFYARPEIKRSTALKRAGNQNAQLQLLAELQKTDTDLRILEELIAQDPHLCIRLLRMINSPLHRRVNEITSLRQAILLLGEVRMRTLVTTLILANDDPSNLLLLPQTLTRAAMCQQIAVNEFKLSSEAAFMTGLLSMADVLLNQDLSALCSELPLSDEIKRALLTQEGDLGRVLKLVQAFEQARMGGLNTRVVDKLNRYFLESRQWSNQILTGIEV